MTQVPAPGWGSERLSVEKEGSHQEESLQGRDLGIELGLPSRLLSRPRPWAVVVEKRGAFSALALLLKMS